MKHKLIIWFVAIALMIVAVYNSPWGIRYNNTPSIATGLYISENYSYFKKNHSVKLNDILSFKYIPPEWAEQYHYYPQGSKFGKYVGALPGDVLKIDKKTESAVACTNDKCKVLGKLRYTDSSGRIVYPIQWNNYKLSKNEYFMRGLGATSFDSRYYGTITEDRFIEVLYPFITW